MLESSVPLILEGIAVQDDGSTAVFAQPTTGNTQIFGGAFGGMEPETLVGVMVVGCGFGLISFVITIWIYISLTLSMMKVPVEHRKMLPGLVWLNLIPCFNFVWSFFIAIWIPQSIESALGPRAADTPTGRSAGMIWAILMAVYVLVGSIGATIGNVWRLRLQADQEVVPMASFVPDLVGAPIALVGLIFLVFFGLQVQSAANMLVEDKPSSTAGEAW